MDTNEISLRKEIARELLANNISEFDGLLEVDEKLQVQEAAVVGVSASLTYPGGLSPQPQAISPKPGINDPLPQADILVVTWTVAEQNALCDIMTPGISRHGWYRYRRNFESHFDKLIRQGDATKKPPSRVNNRLGSWYPVQIGSKKVICFKSELHLNQDGISLTPDGQPTTENTGYATLPVKDLFEQLIAECKPSLVITVGTAGAVYRDHGIGDVVVTRGAKFRLQDEFRKEPYNGYDIEGAQYTCDWDVPTAYFDTAMEMMSSFKANLQEPVFALPTKRFQTDPGPITPWENNGRIHLDGTGALPPFHPIVTTDFFEFGTSANNMEAVGSAMEMGDAVLALVCEQLENAPKWLVIRNLSDPQINADLPIKPSLLNMQTHWAVWYYEKFGYWTSINSALTTWAVIAGLE